jgi:RNA polymerase sigma factor (sigma-70 family)
MSKTAKFNLSVIMKRAWVIYRKHNHQLSWSDSLKQSWAIAKGGEQTIDSVYDKYYGWAINYVKSFLHDLTIAEEVVNDAFVRIAGKLHTFDSDKGKMKTWLTRIMRNACTDYSRKNGLDLVRTDGYVNEDGAPAFEASSTEADPVERMELAKQITSAIANLKDREKRVVTMFYFENRKQDEIGDLMGMSVTYVKQTLLRAKKSLKEELKGAYELLG